MKKLEIGAEFVSIAQPVKGLTVLSVFNRAGRWEVFEGEKIPVKV